jgi:anti-sigma B factor antagonist
MRERESGNWHVLEVSGELDLHTSPRLRERLERAIASASSDVLVDLTGVGFMDSTALGVLVGALKRARALDRDLALVVPDGPPRRVLAITGLDREFTVLEETPATEE